MEHPSSCLMYYLFYVKVRWYSLARRTVDLMVSVAGVTVYAVVLVP